MTLIDYPGKIAATVFTVGCNFRCPFCHNPELVVAGWERGSVSEKEFFDFLGKRKGKLDGVCITGGEPTIQKDIVDFIQTIKELGFLVKLDSNGTRPDVLKKLVGRKLVDYIAMDIKNSINRYEKACMSDIIDGKTYGIDTDRIRLSVDLIRHSGIDYEFRTTVVPGIHRYADFDEIARWLDGSKKYVLQAYREGKIIDSRIKEKIKKNRLDLEKIRKNIKGYFDKVEIR